MSKKEYKAPYTKTKSLITEHSFMEWTDWADTKKGQFVEDEEWDNSADNVWDYKK